MHIQTSKNVYFTLFPCSFILADRLKEERVKEVIKLQTGATRREGGKEEGREEERFLERRSKQDMVKEQKERKTQRWLVPSRGAVFAGALYIPGSNRQEQNTCCSLPDIQDAGEEQTLQSSNRHKHVDHNHTARCSHATCANRKRYAS